uniref:Mitochondrial processing peptidase beta subunit n=1 Tax=Panagrellus redivivus TaxID=6233 RepID=A0A7E4UQZ6_PANRE
MALRVATGLKPLGQIRQASALASTAQEVLANTNKASLTELKNGFRISSVENNRPLTTIGVWIDAGSRYENSNNNGISSFVEQVLYHGGANRSKAQLETELAKLGARLNSYTSREHTAYFVQVPNGQVEKVVDILAKVLRNGKFDDAAVEAERKILLRKLQESEDNLNDVVLDNLHATAFQGTPFQLSPLGNTTALKELTAQDLQQYAEDHYKPVRMVLAGAGGVSHEQLAGLGEKYFGDLSNSYDRKISQNGNVRFTGSEFRYRDDTLPFFYGAVAVEGVTQSHPDALALQVASTLVGGWSNTSNLNVNSPNPVVQKLSILPALQSYQSFSINYNTTGLFGFQFISKADDQADITEIVSLVQRQWKHLATGVTDLEIDRVKNALKTEVLTVADDSTRLADLVARNVLNTGETVQLSDVERAINKVDAAAVREAVSRNVYDRDIAVAAVGRSEATPNYAQLRYGMSWWRL